MSPRAAWIRVLLTLAIGAMLVAFAVGMSAQVQTTESTKTGTPTHQVQVERATVVHVSGNDLVVKMADGTIRDFSNVPESTRVMVDGKELGIHDLQPGMTLQRTITTTTTPKIITTTQTVTGKIWHVQPPNSVILTLEDGKNQQFKIPPGQKFMVNGQELDAWHLRKGMTVSATKVVEEPATSVTEKRVLSGSMPPPAPPAADQPILVAVIVPVATPAAAQESAPSAMAQESAPQQLPKTGGELPLLVLLGCLSLAGSAGSRLLRRIVH
jgi:hypothetical protein